ncbi:hypothetical protein ACQRIU_002756 [Beauveria bassiana]
MSPCFTSTCLPCAGPGIAVGDLQPAAEGQVHLDLCSADDVIQEATSVRNAILYQCPYTKSSSQNIMARTGIPTQHRTT